jgi:hypothetical protein
VIAELLSYRGDLGLELRVLAACAMPSQTQSAMRFSYAKFYSRSHDAVIRVFDESGNVIETHEQAGDSQRAVNALASVQPFSGHSFYEARNRLHLAIYF